MLGCTVKIILFAENFVLLSVYLEEWRKFFFNWFPRIFLLLNADKILYFQSIFQLMCKKLDSYLKAKENIKGCPESIETLDLQRSFSAGSV